MSKGKVEILHVDLEVESYKLKNFVNLTEEELEMVRRWRNNPEIRKWFYHQHEITKEEHINYVKHLKNTRDKVYWLVEESNNRLGVIFFKDINMNHRHAFLGLYANPELKNKGKGVGSKLMRIIIKIAFDILELHTLKLTVFSDNKKAISLYKRFGFEEEGRLREFINRSGKWIDVIIMGMIKPKLKY